MRSAEASAHTFVVRVWVEEPAAEGRPGVWRGHITNVLEGDRKHVQDLSQISGFIAHFLREMGVEPSVLGEDDSPQGHSAGMT